MTKDEFDMEYEHVHKKFRVIVAPLEWWDRLSGESKEEQVKVYKLGYPGGGRCWKLSVRSFKKLYRSVS